MTKTIRVLIMEESNECTATLLQMLKEGGIPTIAERVDTLTALTAAFEDATWDLVLADYQARRYDALDALAIFKQTGLDIPFIVLSGTRNEKLAVEAMRAGAQDFLFKDNLTRLIPVIEREMREMEIRSAHRRADETIRYHAYHDALTRLPNRALFIDRLQQTIISTDRHSIDISLLLIDLNKFHEVNDSLGHHTGDILLQQVANRLRDSVRRSDTVARMDGIEFAVMFTGVDHSKALFSARKIMENLEKPYLLNVTQCQITASMGVAFFPEHGHTVDLLLNHADIALQAAKKNEGGFTVYRTNQSGQTAMTHMALSSELQMAIEYNHLTLHYQPKVDMKTAMVTGVEALVRWEHPKHGFVSPEEFIPLAEQTEIIQELTLWVLNKALTQYKKWADTGITLKIAVNLSMMNLVDPKCHEGINKLLDAHNVPPHTLELELTETTMMSDPAMAMRKMEQLTQRGIDFAVDDFGTGYSSLSYLKRLPVKVLKIDKSFVQDISKDDHDAVIVRATIDLAHNLGLKVVAEGIEDRETWEILHMLRCDMAQGYYISRPIFEKNVQAWMQSYKPTDFASATVT